MLTLILFLYFPQESSYRWGLPQVWPWRQGLRDRGRRQEDSGRVAILGLRDRTSCPSSRHEPWWGAAVQRVHDILDRVKWGTAEWGTSMSNVNFSVRRNLRMSWMAKHRTASPENAYKIVKTVVLTLGPHSCSYEACYFEQNLHTWRGTTNIERCFNGLAILGALSQYPVNCWSNYRYMNLAQSIQ